MELCLSRAPFEGRSQGDALSENRIPGLRLVNAADDDMRLKVDQGIRRLAETSAHHLQGQERLRGELREKNRELSELRKTVAALRRERERLREIFLSLEKKLMALSSSEGEESR